jgi:hypothetical protein
LDHENSRTFFWLSKISIVWYFHEVISFGLHPRNGLKNMRNLCFPSVYTMWMKLLKQKKYEELEEYFCSLDPWFLEYFVHCYPPTYKEEEEKEWTVFFANII